MEKIPSKWIQLKELKLAFCKSEADMVHTKVFGEESETSEKQVPKGETADMEVQVGMSVDPDFFHQVRDDEEDGEYDIRAREFEDLEDEERDVHESRLKKGGKKRQLKSLKSNVLKNEKITKTLERDRSSSRMRSGSRDLEQYNVSPRLELTRS